MAVSPRMLRWRLDHPEPESPAMRLGTSIHCAILEPKVFHSRWTVAGSCAATKKDGGACGSQGSLISAGQWYCKVKGHAPEGAGLPEGFEILTADEFKQVETCAASVRDHKVAAQVLKKGLAEHEIQWTEPETGILCRGRIDFLRPKEVVDLKSTHEESVWGFTRHATTRLYHAQLAWYHDGAIAARKLQPDAQLPILVSVQTTEPYDVAVYRLTKVSLEAGRVLYRDLLLKYRDCLGAEHWPGIAPALLDFDVPNWAPGMNGSNYEGENW